MSSEDWKTVAQAATLLGKHRSAVFRYLERPETDTGIRRMRPGTVTLVHMPTLRAYEAKQKVGRPRKTT